MGNKWNDQWWSLVKAEKHKEEQHVRTVKRKSKRVRRRKRR